MKKLYRFYTLCLLLLLLFWFLSTQLLEPLYTTHIQKQLTEQADAIVAAGKASAEAERQSKLREADAQTTALARAMCEKLLARNLTAQDDARLLDDLLEKAGAGNGN